MSRGVCTVNKATNSLYLSFLLEMLNISSHYCILLCHYRILKIMVSKYMITDYVGFIWLWEIIVDMKQLFIMKESISNKRLCGRVVKAVDSSSTIVKMHEFEPRRSHYLFYFFEEAKCQYNHGFTTTSYYFINENTDPVVFNSMMILKVMCRHFWKWLQNIERSEGSSLYKLKRSIPS